MENFEKGRKLMFFILVAFFVWILVSIYWYTCLIKGFCNKETNFLSKNNTIEIKNKDNFNNGVEYQEKYIQLPKTEITPKEKTLIENKTVESKKEVIKCMTYLNSNIKLNSKENYPSEVKKLEEFLNSYNSENLIIDSVYGKKDFEAVKRFQKINKLVEDGIIGPNTRKVINVIYCIKNKK